MHRVCIEGHRRFYNEVRPHSALRYQTPNQFRQRWKESQQAEREKDESIDNKIGE